MSTESEDIIHRFGLSFPGKLADFYPYYSALHGEKEIFLVQTHVGSINAPAATALALSTIKPDVAIKVGCIGGNAPCLRQNEIIVPLSFFHTGAWITRSMEDDSPTSNASLWQGLYGDEPYQNSKANLGGINYSFLPDQKVTAKYKEILTKEGISFSEAHLGSGDMVIFDHPFMDHIRKDILGQTDPNAKWCSDNESHAVAQVCNIFHIPFTGVYFVASSDYEDIGGYDPDGIRTQTKQTILPIVEKLIESL